MSQISNLFLSIGKPVKDEYGRAIGKVASFALTPSGQFDAAFIEFSDGKFSKQPMEHLKFNGAEVTFISTIKSRASVLCDQIPLIWRKDQALKDLIEKNGYCEIDIQYLEKTEEDLKKRGAKFSVEPSVSTTGAKYAFVDGPEGIRIELVERDRKEA